VETDVLPALAAKGQLTAFQHDGFWQCMDTLPRDARANGIWEARECALGVARRDEGGASAVRWWRGRRVLVTATPASSAAGCARGSTRWAPA